MTFKEYLARRRITDTPAGDFTAGARRDRQLPNVTTWKALRLYLERTTTYGDRDAVIRAGYDVWQGYQRALRKSGHA